MLYPQFVVSLYIQLSDFGMEQLREKCPHLRELQIRSCNSLTDAGIEAVTVSMNGF